MRKDVSTKYPENRLVRKGRRKKAKPGYGRQALTDNRNGLLFGQQVTGTTEAVAGKELSERQTHRRRKPKTFGGDRRCDCQSFESLLCSGKISPHVSANTKRKRGSAMVMVLSNCCASFCCRIASRSRLDKTSLSCPIP